MSISKIEAATDLSLQREWDKRAQREGLVSVMSSRWPPELCEQATAELKKAIFEFLPPLYPHRILEIGCGIGRFTPDLAKKAQTEAIDISYRMLERARPVTTGGNTCLLQASCTNLPFPPNEFDLIFTVTVLQHIVNDADFKASLAQIKEVLAPEGIVFICDEVGPEKKQISPYTTIRTLTDYEKGLSPLVLAKTSQHLCIEDPYLLMLFENR